MNTFVFQSKFVCGYKEKTTHGFTPTGKERWSYHGYLEVNPKTGAYLKPRKKDFSQKQQQNLITNDKSSSSGNQKSAHQS